MCKYEGNDKKGEVNGELARECKIEGDVGTLEEKEGDLKSSQLDKKEISEQQLEEKVISEKLLDEKELCQTESEAKEINEKELNKEGLDELSKGLSERLNEEEDKHKNLNGEKVKKPKKQISSLIKIFSISMLITSVVMGMVTLAGVTVYKSYTYTKEKEKPIIVEQVKETKKAESEIPMVSNGGINNVTNQTLGKPLNKTIAVFGTDISGGLTDVIFLVHFNDKSKEINVIAVPRDTKVEWTEEQIKAIAPRNQWVHSSKINEMTSLGGIENIRVLTIQTIEKLMGVKVDEYIIVNLNAFKEIVDAVGGVEVEVKQRMKKDDFSQNLHIDLYPGVQLLDGDKAEQFVRFRSYKIGDIGRIQAQQQFLQAFAKKVLSPEIIVKLPEIATIVYHSVKTDIGLTDMLKYLPYIQNIKEDYLYFHTLPGEAHYENHHSYYFLNQEKVTELVDDIFFKTNN